MTGEEVLGSLVHSECDWIREDLVYNLVNAAEALTAEMQGPPVDKIREAIKAIERANDNEPWQ
tara:strand:+ start:1956 stop:2144 length:189 start_codon:yes stop_codon:yes gene_type:complete